MSALGDTPQNKPAPQVFIKNWSDICREWSERYGKLVSGWWFDGYYVPAGWANLQAEHNWKTWAEAVRAGNPDAELAFNRGARARVAFIRLNGAQTYTAVHAGRRVNGTDAKVKWRGVLRGERCAPSLAYLVSWW